MKKIGFLLSGSGSTLKNLIQKINEKYLEAQISVVISSKSNVYGLKIAEENNIPCFVVEYSEHKKDLDEYSKKITEILKKYNVDLVVMGGFMSFYKVPEIYTNKVLNIHPALIPSFCGKGMYGLKVHKAVIEYGVKITGCTVHFVDNEYDHGPIIYQEAIRVLDNDTPESLAERVKEVEKRVYPYVIKKILENKFRIINRKVFLEED
ncbi:MAG TPA: phosphoribosylglycinamide formyltransferase [Spirochaetota bacterium]|nr:phosphoribosylglycinamide formyltransferase [Spirochaetota bacterium]HOM39076.1 phosphoribosylglycinamide formyltransferase [Spirochaetota bacterium]HPQ49982.1 phosphoribosylglycinamide formyltransferase [Spirochaetota bacterium]